MADAPERIWANGLGCYGETNMGGTEYIRADVARADAELAVAEAIRRAAEKLRAEDHHWGDAIAAAIPTPADALAEVQRLRDNLAAEEAAGAAMIRGCRVLTDDLKSRAERAEAERDAALARVENLREALAWYGEQSRLARLIHKDGDAGRNAIAADGGKRARAALAEDARHG